MRVLVCGGRAYSNWACVVKTLGALDQVARIEVVIHGAATGADRLGEHWADRNLRRSIPFVAEWRDRGKAAGPIRNQKMIDEGKPDIVVAFPGGKGTADMTQRAERAGLFVLTPESFLDETELLRKLEPLLRG